MTEKDLLQLIDLYFDGATTLAQERELREALLKSKSNNPRVDEALAVMTFAAEDGQRRATDAVAPRHGRRASWLSLAAAAAVAVLLAVGVWVGRNPVYDDGGCSTVIACVPSDDPAVALALMNAQLGDISEASDNVNEAIASDFASLSEAFNEI